MEKSPEENRKTIEVVSKVRSESALLIGRMATQLHEEYLKSDTFKQRAEEGRAGALDPHHFQQLAEARVSNDLRVATIVLSQEGQIPPKNAFHGKDEVVRLAMSLEGDKKLLWNIEHGYADICVHEQQNIGNLLDLLLGGGPRRERNRDRSQES